MGETVQEIGEKTGEMYTSSRQFNNASNTLELLLHYKITNTAE